MGKLKIVNQINSKKVEELKLITTSQMALIAIIQWLIITDTNHVELKIICYYGIYYRKIYSLSLIHI